MLPDAGALLRSLALEIIRMVALTCIAIEVHLLPGPYLPLNWRIGKLDVGCEDYGAARDKADALQGSRHWIMVPDGDPLDGQPYGREQAPRS